VTEALTTVLGGPADLPSTSIGATYSVCKPRDRRVVYTAVAVSGSTPPRFRLLEGEGQRELGVLTSNFIRSRYEVHAGPRPLASLVFPAVAFDKSLLLTVGNELFEGEGSVFRGVFQCKDASGEIALEIAKQLSIRDTFSVRTIERLPVQVALLTAIALHARFYQMV
jgi:uncharacterized protein YxjI